MEGIMCDMEFNRNAPNGKGFFLPHLEDIPFNFFGTAEPCDEKRDDAGDEELKPIRRES
jgi:hypothetical protein